jgi:galactokinase
MRRHVAAAFHAWLGASPAVVVRAPGRVNLIGEHTDYQDGFVLPMAIDRAVWIALRPRDGRRVRLRSLDYDQTTDFTLGELGGRAEHAGSGWAEYVKGVAWALQDAGHTLQGWDGVVTGDVPVGAGLASSAAIEMAAARAFAAVSDFPWDSRAIATIGQRAENRWVGVRCGIMDQMISAGGVAGHALLIDCRTLDASPVPLPPKTAVVVLDTTTRRGLVDSIYNTRRAECESAARFFGVPALRDVSMGRLASLLTDLPEPIGRRARHVIGENDRTLQAADAMRRGDAAAFGHLMNASHASLRDDFEVSSAELDLMVDCACREAACHGARMTGAGFGGCAVALVSADTADDFVAAVTAMYQAASGRQPRAYVCEAARGADEVIPRTVPRCS